MGDRAAIGEIKGNVPSFVSWGGEHNLPLRFLDGNIAGPWRLAPNNGANTNRKKEESRQKRTTARPKTCRCEGPFSLFRHGSRASFVPISPLGYARSMGDESPNGTSELRICVTIALMVG
jgi:hypothetical protein